jgi:hypothetical protein
MQRKQNMGFMRANKLAKTFLMGSVIFGSSFLFQAHLTQAKPHIETAIYLPLQSFVDLSLDKLGSPLFLPAAQKISATDVYKVALNLGVATTDAIVALKNKDKAQFEKHAILIYEYAKRLNLNKNILSTYSQIQTPLKKNQFDQLEKIMTEMREQIAKEMNKSYRKDQARLAYVAGWIEGLYIATESIDKKFSPQKSALLLYRAPLIAQLIKHMTALNISLQQRKDVIAIIHALPQLKVTMEKKNLSQKDIQHLAKICASVHTIIVN